MFPLNSGLSCFINSDFLGYDLNCFFSKKESERRQNLQRDSLIRVISD